MSKASHSAVKVCAAPAATTRGHDVAGGRERNDWLEGWRSHLTLLGLADDDTCKAPTALFQEGHEDAAGYLRWFQRQLEQPGVPLSIYRDQHGTIQRNDAHRSLEEQLGERQFPTQMGRALEDLGIEAIVIRSPHPGHPCCSARHEIALPTQTYAQCEDEGRETVKKSPAA